MGNFNCLKQLDTFCHILLCNEVSRRSSINQGKCFYRVITGTFPKKFQERLNIDDDNKENLIFVYSHFAPVFGFACGCLGLSLELTDKLFMRMAIRDVISAAARLNIIGPMDGSYLQAEFGRLIENNYLLNNETIEDVSPNEVIVLGSPINFYNDIRPHQTAPITDFLQSRQDLLYSRLFNS